MMRAFLDHTKCPPSSVAQITCSPTAEADGFFRLGELRLYGRISGGSPSPKYADDLIRIDAMVSGGNGSAILPFDPTEIIDNLRLEKYVRALNRDLAFGADHHSLSRRLYYALRPLFPVAFRRILQRMALQDWATLPFPSWPVDTTVEDLIAWLWRMVLETSGEKEIPFIWYWPEGFESCAIMTHDVETSAGQEFCQNLLDLEREHGIRSAFELVPEVRYEVSERVMTAIRDAGGEICVHGLNHDGRLFSSEGEFRKRARAINAYAAKWGAKGFRSPIMYRNHAWYDAFKLSYDMSMPNVGHLDPQRGGCCTVFPFFIGDVLELPLTTTQDYPIYNILRCDAMAMWTAQIEAVHAKNGLASFIIHPDYTVAPEKQALYRELLSLIERYGKDRKMWLALPGEVDTWWRERSNMTLVRVSGAWSINGKGSARAALAYACLENGKVSYVVPRKDGSN